MNLTRFLTVTVVILYVVFCIAVVGAAIYLFLLIIKALKKIHRLKRGTGRKENYQKIFRRGIKEKPAPL